MENSETKSSTNNKPKAVIFARVSTTRQEKEGMSLRKNQIPEAQEYAKKNNFNVVKTFAVSETGGRYKKRKEFDKMIEYIKTHPDVTEVISFRVNRIVRNLADVIVVEDLRLIGKSFHFIRDSLTIGKNSTRQDIVMWELLAIFAKDYLEGVREDGVDTKEAKLDYGELPWTAPYGYRNTGKVGHRTVEVVEPEATIVKEIFEKYATGAYSCESLADELNERYGALGQRFSKGKVQTILSNTFYFGKIYDRKRDLYFPHIYQKLTDEETFELCQEIRSSHGLSHTRAKGNVPFTYRGLMQCKECGCGISPDHKERTQKNGNVHEHFYYHCANGKKVHIHQHNVDEYKIDEQVEDTLSEFTLSAERLNNLSLALQKAHADKIEFYETERGRLAKRRALIKKRQKNAYDDRQDRVITAEEYDENNKRYQEELREIDDKELQLEGVDERFYTTTSYLAELFSKLKDLFSAGTTDNKREILKLLFSKLSLNGSNVEFTVEQAFADCL